MTTDRSIPVIAFTDGAAKGNPGPGGWGAVLLVAGAAVRELGGAGGATTNNRMEITAALEALEWLAAAPDIDGADVLVVTDSTYVLRGATEWLRNWKKRGWKTTSGGEVANRDLWERLEGALARHRRVGWRYVPGHAGVPGNERADQIASDFASGKTPGLFAGPAEGYGFDLRRVPDADAPMRSVSKASGSRSKGAAHSYLSLVDGVAQRHRTWAECERRVRGRSGARFRKTGSAADEKALLDSWGATLGGTSRGD